MRGGHFPSHSISMDRSNRSLVKLSPIMPGMKPASHVLPLEIVERRIYMIRGHKVMLSTHLAELYEVEPRALVQAVKRNAKRFPEDFIFQLTMEEFANLKSQIVISSWGGSRRAAPYAFTEHGVAMLSSVLKSKRAIAVNIAIVRAFVRLRQLLATHRNLAAKLEAMEKKYDRQFKAVFEMLSQLTEAQAGRPKHPIGFLTDRK
jgi:hypothetical protein